MLEQKSLKNEIVSFKIVTGEEIVGKLVVDNPFYVIDKPIVIGIQMVQKNQAGITFMPFMASINDDGAVTFFKEQVVTQPTKTRQDIAQNYISATSKIELPQTPGLILPTGR